MAVKTEDRRVELANKARALPALEKRVADMEAKRKAKLAEANAKHRAALEKVREFEKKPLGKARGELADAHAAMSELVAQHVPRDLVTTEANAQSLVSRLGREVEVQRNRIAGARGVVGADELKGRKPARDLLEKIAAEEARLGDLVVELGEASKAWETARKELDTAVEAALSPEAA